MTRRCQDHCSACGSRFTSVRAFDAHRSGSFKDGGTRVCWAEDNEEAAKLRIATEEAVCEMYMDHEGNGIQAPVRLWEHGPRVDQARASFAVSGDLHTAERGSSENR